MPKLPKSLPATTLEFRVAFHRPKIPEFLKTDTKSYISTAITPNTTISHLQFAELSEALSFTRIFATIIYTNRWRQAIIVPIPKEGKDHCKPQGYRLVSLTCCLSKVLENMANSLAAGIYRPSQQIPKR